MNDLQPLAAGWTLRVYKNEDKVEIYGPTTNRFMFFLTKHDARVLAEKILFHLENGYSEQT